MKTTVIKVQNIETEIDIVRFAFKLSNYEDFPVKLKNGKWIKLKGKDISTYLIFDNGTIRFNKPVKISEDVK
jgi:hypothetical protein|tara:strand:+ start:1382 stop:1597 length:216 start_codon:yes stop_codon:yes gene_type:complete